MIFSALVLFILIGSAASCSCAWDSTLKDDFEETPIIFIGRVIGKRPFNKTNMANEYLMKVEEAFKGTTAGARIIVRINEQTAACGIQSKFVTGRWQMWLNSNGWTNSCTRSTSKFDKDRTQLQELANSIKP